MQQRQPHRVVPSTPNLVISRDGHPFATAGDHQIQPAASAGNAGTGSVAVHIPTSGAPHDQGLDAAPSSNGGRAGAGHLKSGTGLAGHYPPSSHSTATGAGHARNGSDGAGGGGAAPPLLPIGRTSPSRVAASSNLSSSVHLPLLAASDHDSAGAASALLDDDDTHAYRIRTPHKSAASSLLSMFLPKPGPRTRLHPFLLLPAFICGMLLTWTGQQSDTARRIVTSTLPSDYVAIASGRPNYTIHTSGHLYVDPAALHASADSSPLALLDSDQASVRAMRHPIHDLINNATREWEAKLARQSKTLVEAVREYKRRYNRNPPKGFDKWFEFAQANSVVLIDEFDQTFNDVLPFWALPPSMIANRSQTIQADPNAITLKIIKGKVEVAGTFAKHPRALDQSGLMKRWAKYVDDVNITMSGHDGPSIMMDWETRQKHIDAAKAGKLLTQEEADGVNDDAAWWGYPLACPPDSRIRRAYNGLEINSLPRGPAFVHDHTKTMDLCANPEWQYLHGFTAWPGARPRRLLPLFSFAKMSIHSDILLTPLEQYWDHEPWDPKWEDKQSDKAVWRGSTTGVWFDRTTWWRASQRVRVWFMGKDEQGSRRVRFLGQGVETPKGVESLVEHDVPTRKLVDKYLDFAFSGKAGQCDVEDGSCDAVKKLFDFQRAFGWNEANEYRYLLDLDGNAWSGRFHRLLSSNSAVIKSTIFPEWYNGWIQPWVHYIPLRVDYTDLFDIMAFFTGDLEGRNAHPELGKQIADNGKEYADKYWRYADMETYLFRVLLEWARVSSHDRPSMDYTGPGT
ncbi:hypothetical protein JCM8115_000048 [Rhodotorula mucilaginosa]|uniref:Glycosyl transferase CAP10 domain-containing protein n=1 Tax=Rhodotorula mucilaginosa TaxID=5537 RepID=A0A9P6VWG8_RHOMI|nr:hypothetical protein C6P46_006722 [Rhodotorula mucilaginosa]